RLRQAQAGGERRDDGETVLVAELLNRTDDRKGRMMKRREPLHLLADRRLEAALARERRSEAEDFPRRRARVVEHQQPIAGRVRVSLRVPGRQVSVAVAGW